MNLIYSFNRIIKFLNIWGLGIGDWGLGPIPNPQSPKTIKKAIKEKK